MAAGIEDLLPHSFQFGPFRLVIRERRLLNNGHVIPLGSRAFDLLVVLVGNAGKTIGKRELMTMVWPDMVVDDGTLRFHIAALRKALGDDELGARYILTLLGRGYRFAADVLPVGSAPAKLHHATDTPHNLPSRLARLLGRETAMRTLPTRLLTERFVSIIGPGGIGKTTLAIALAHELLAAFGRDVCFVDLGSVIDPAMAADAVASALGIAVRTADASAGIIAFLRDQRKLLILDSCEHVIEAIGLLSEQIRRDAPETHILATSREALRVEGEWAYRIAALEAPPEQATICAADILAFPAIQLFVERMAGGESAFELGEDEAPAVADICRGLDGIPLAIELAAGRVGVLGVAETARLLDGRFPLAWRGRRTAHPRHQTLAATLDWSHDLLTDVERLVLRRLAIFLGSFSLDAARSVASSDALDDGRVLEALAGLVDKSLLVVTSAGTTTSYRLLDTTRAYVVDKLASSGDLSGVARRHATFFRDRLEREADESAEPEGTLTRNDLGNVRAALEWCFGRTGDTEIGIDLTAAAAPLLLRLSLLTECTRWTERALTLLTEGSKGTRQEMALQASLGVSLMFTTGNSKRVLTSFERSLMIAERLGDLERQVRLLGSLNILHLRMGRHRSALAYAQRSAAAALKLGDPDAIAATEGLVGSNYNLLGRNTEAQALLVSSVAQGMPSGRPVQLGFSTRNHAMISLALTLWIVGLHDQALVVARDTVDEAVQLGHPGTVCVALLYAISVFLWTGDLNEAEEHMERFMAEAKRNSLLPYLAAGMGIKAEIAICRGQVESGVTVLRASLELLQREVYQIRLTAFACAIADGLMSLGRLDEARATIDDAIGRGERDGDLVAMPEMLRIKGEIMACTPGAEPHDGETLILRSIGLARSQAALSWELRSAMSLARLWSCQGRFHDAAQLLTAVYGRFTEGFASADLTTARQLLAELNHRRLDTPSERSRRVKKAAPTLAQGSDHLACRNGFLDG